MTTIRTSRKDIDIVKLLDYFVLDNLVVEDLGFVEMKFEKETSILQVGVVCTKPGRHVQSLVPILVVDNDISPAHRIEVSIDNAQKEKILGKSLACKEMTALGANRLVVSRIWLLSKATLKDEAKKAVAKEIFNSRTIGKARVEIASASLEFANLVPCKTIEELKILADLGQMSNE